MAIRRRSLDELLLEQGVGADRLAEARKAAEKSGSTFVEAVQRAPVPQAEVSRGIATLTGLLLLEEIDVERVEIERRGSRKRP